MGLFFELPQEISQIVVAAFQTDFHNRQIRLFQQMQRLLDPVFADIFHRGASQGFSEETAEILLIHIDNSGKIPDVDLFLIIFPDIGQSCLNPLHPFVVVFLYGSKEPMGRQQGKNAQKRGFDI